MLLNPNAFPFLFQIEKTTHVLYHTPSCAIFRDSADLRLQRFDFSTNMLFATLDSQLLFFRIWNGSRLNILLVI